MPAEQSEAYLLKYATLAIEAADKKAQPVAPLPVLPVAKNEDSRRAADLRLLAEAKAKREEARRRYLERREAQNTRKQDGLTERPRANVPGLANAREEMNKRTLAANSANAAANPVNLIDGGCTAPRADAPFSPRQTCPACGGATRCTTCGGSMLVNGRKECGSCWRAPNSSAPTGWCATCEGRGQVMVSK
jgi:hypothetical protein